MDAAGDRPSRLDILKALGDNTRYAIYLELARSPVPLATADIADTLDLHPNTVRPHLERMREVGLLVVESDPRGLPGRPQHRYSLTPDSPSLGLEPASFPLLARMLLRLAQGAGAVADDARAAGREQGRADADGLRHVDATIAVAARMAELGFDPMFSDADDGPLVDIAFSHCPFRDLAEQRPDLVCSLHRGMVEGLVAELGGASVASFGTLTDRAPCRVGLHLDDALGEPIGSSPR